MLRIPLFAKILIANAVIVVIATFAGAGFAIPGIALSVVANALILAIALRPLEGLERTVERVRGGDLDARAPASSVADANLERLIEMFNATLDSLALSRSRLRDVARGALAAQEAERARIAHELHDDTAQVLASLRVRLEAARRAEDSARRDALLDEVRNGLGDAVESVRRFARGLRPPALDELGLRAALEAHAGTLDASGPRLDLGVDAIGRLSPETELALYRIIQEAIANAARHAAARTITVKVARDGDWVTAAIEDDGRGFDVAAVRSTGPGLGLYGMQERAGYLGGSVVVDSKPGAGCRIRARVPAGQASARA